MHYISSILVDRFDVSMLLLVWLLVIYRRCAQFFFLSYSNVWSSHIMAFFFLLLLLISINTHISFSAIWNYFGYLKRDHKIGQKKIWFRITKQSKRNKTKIKYSVLLRQLTLIHSIHSIYLFFWSIQKWWFKMTLKNIERIPQQQHDFTSSSSSTIFFSFSFSSIMNKQFFFALKIFIVEIEFEIVDFFLKLI